MSTPAEIARGLEAAWAGLYAAGLPVRFGAEALQRSADAREVAAPERAGRIDRQLLRQLTTLAAQAGVAVRVRGGDS